MSPNYDCAVDVRAQILDNWRFVHPDRSDVVVLTMGNRGYYHALIADNRSKGNRIFVKVENEDSVKASFELLLVMTNDMVSEVLKDTPIKPLIINRVDRKTNNNQENSIKVEPDTQTPETKKLKRFHEALGHVIDLASGE